VVVRIAQGAVEICLRLERRPGGPRHQALGGRGLRRPPLRRRDHADEAPPLHHGHAVGLQLGDLGGVERGEARVAARRPDDAAVQRPREVDVVREAERRVQLRRQLHPRLTRADDAVVVRVHHRRTVVERDERLPPSQQLRVADAAVRPAARDAEAPALCDQAVGGHAEVLRRPTQQRLVGGRRRLAQLDAAVLQRLAARGHALADAEAGVALDVVDVGDAEAQLFDHDLRQRGLDASAELHLARVDGDRVLGEDEPRLGR
jgi:hypothetical protein